MSTGGFFLVFLVGLGAGFLNVISGGGSLLTMPVMIFLGLPSAVANGTNRIALMVQNIVAITNFKRKGFFNWPLSLLLGLPAVAGSVIGAQLAIYLSDEVFNKILGIVMLMILGLILWQPKKKVKEEEKEDIELGLQKRVLGSIIFFFIGIYGGLFQGGVGFIIIASLTLLTNYSLVRINSLKVFIVATYMVISLIVFIANGKVDWVLGLVLAAGNGLGGYLGSNFAMKKGDKWIRVIVMTTVSLMALKLLIGF